VIVTARLLNRGFLEGAASSRDLSHNWSRLGRSRLSMAFTTFELLSIKLLLREITRLMDEHRINAVLFHLKPRCANKKGAPRSAFQFKHGSVDLRFS
jgi:hypothetical protein